jgi:gamma-glutamylcyclotransferase (GGCT)/AIG2-like uncharacterized protein YtfP
MSAQRPPADGERPAGERLFAYGTLRDPARMTRLLGAAPPRAPARLSGWRCEGVRGESFPGIVPDPDASVEGDLYGRLDPTALRRLDAYEGPLYERIRVRVDARTGAPAEAWVYALRPAHRGRLDGRPWSAAPPAGAERPRP